MSSNLQGCKHVVLETAKDYIGRYDLGLLNCLTGHPRTSLVSMTWDYNWGAVAREQSKQSCLHIHNSLGMGTHVQIVDTKLLSHSLG